MDIPWWGWLLFTVLVFVPVFFGLIALGIGAIAIAKGWFD